MASVESVKNLIAEAKGMTLILMQEGDTGGTVPFTNQDWADEMYRAWTHLGEAENCVKRAELYA